MNPDANWFIKQISKKLAVNKITTLSHFHVSFSRLMGNIIKHSRIYLELEPGRKAGARKNTREPSLNQPNQKKKISTTMTKVLNCQKPYFYTQLKLIIIVHVEHKWKSKQVSKLTIHKGKLVSGNVPFIILQGNIACQDVTILCSPLHIRMPRTMIKNKTLNL